MMAPGGASVCPCPLFAQRQFSSRCDPACHMGGLSLVRTGTSSRATPGIIRLQPPSGPLGSQGLARVVGAMRPQPLTAQLRAQTEGCRASFRAAEWSLGGLGADSRQKICLFLILKREPIVLVWIVQPKLSDLAPFYQESLAVSAGRT